MNNKNKVIKVNILGQDYFVRSTAKANYFKEISNYVNEKMDEIIATGIDSNTQQLKIAVLACMNIADEFISFKKDNVELINQIQAKSSSIIEYIDDKLVENK